MSTPDTPQPSRLTEAACPACGTIVKQVASASLELALWQHWNWACSRESEPPAAPAEGETAEGLSARLPRYRVDGRYGGAIQCYRSDTGEWVRFSDVEQAETFALAASREAQARQAEQIARLTHECEIARAEHRGSAAAAASLHGDLQRYAQALILAWGGVCPADRAMDPTQPMYMAETIRARGDELQAEVSTLRAKLAEAERTI